MISKLKQFQMISIRKAKQTDSKKNDQNRIIIIVENNFFFGE